MVAERDIRLVYFLRFSTGERNAVPLIEEISIKWAQIVISAACKNMTVYGANALYRSSGILYDIWLIVSLFLVQFFHSVVERGGVYVVGDQNMGYFMAMDFLFEDGLVFSLGLVFLSGFNSLCIFQTLEYFY